MTLFSVGNISFASSRSRVRKKSVIDVSMREKGFSMEICRLRLWSDLYRYYVSIAGNSYLSSRADAQKRTIIDVDYGHPRNSNDMLYLR